MARDPYEVLGVRPDATAETIKAAYRRMVRATHPDVGGEAFAFRAIQDAYALLEDPSRRASFDRQHKTEEPPRPAEPPPPPRRPSQRSDPPRRPRPEDLTVPVWVGQIPAGALPAIVPGRGLEWIERLMMPALTVLLWIGFLLPGDGTLWLVACFLYTYVAIPLPRRTPLRYRWIKPAIGFLLLAGLWFFLLSGELSFGQLLLAALPPTVLFAGALASTAWLRAYLEPARRTKLDEVRRFNSFWPAGFITPDDEVAEFAALFTAIPAARLIHEHRGARSWVLVGNRAVAFTEEPTVDLSGISSLEVQVYSYQRHLLGDLQGSLESIGAWLLEGEGGGLVIDRRQLGILAS